MAGITLEQFEVLGAREAYVTVGKFAAYPVLLPGNMVRMTIGGKSFSMTPTEALEIAADLVRMATDG